jgi:triacylglycerol lipase
MNIVLAHGIFGFRTLVGIHYFNGVKSALESVLEGTPVRVLVTGVPPAGRIELRGAQLRQEIHQALDTGLLDAREKVHIIAHSMGGLDARFALSPANKNNLAARVASLSTISTPHRGSLIANVLTANNLLDRLTIPAVREVTRSLDLSTQGLQDLTTRALETFNEEFPDHPDVRYFSYAGKGRDGSKRTCTLLLAAYGLISLKTKQENDGLVTVDSATWGEELVETWPADHADEIGHDLDRGPLATPGSFDHLQAYRRIVERLRGL